MATSLTFITSPVVKQLLTLAESYREALRYPNCENSGDERRYAEVYEKKILELIAKDKQNASSTRRPR